MKVKSCTALLLMLVVCIIVYPKSVMRYKYPIFGYLSSGNRIHGSMGVRIRGYFSKQQGVRETKILGNTAVGQFKSVPVQNPTSHCPCPSS